MFGGITSFFKKKTKNLVWFFALFMLFFLDFDVTFADEATKAESLEFWIEIANGLLKLIAAIMSIMTAFVTLFLQPTWVNGSYIDLDLYLKQIWILVANVVYVVFAFILIIIAFANIIGKGQGNFELKQALPRFVVGILIVPLSWFIVQFMISLSGVLTVQALTLPYETFKDKGENMAAFTDLEINGNTSLMKSNVCIKPVIHLGEYATPNGLLTEGQDPDDKVKDPISCTESVTVGEILRGEVTTDNGEESIYGIIALYTFGLIGIESLDNLEQAHVGEGGVTRLISLFMKEILSLLFVLVYFVLLIALFFALFLRVLRIWIYVMLSPVFGLMYFFGKSTSGVGDFAAKFNLKEFFALTMTPVYVALALSFGFMFMLVASSGFKAKAGINDETTVANIEIGIFEVEITGAMGGDAGIEDGEINLGSAIRSFRGLGGAMGEIIVMLFGIGVLWIAVMGAMKQSEITKAAVSGIEGFGNSIGKLAASAPMYAPIIPTGKGTMTSAAGIGNLANRGFAEAGNYKVKEGQKLGELFGFLDGKGAAGISAAAQEARNNLGIYEPQTEGFTNEIKKATFIEGATLDTLSNSNEYLELMNTALKKIGSNLEPQKGNKNDISDALKAIDAYREENGGNGVFKGLVGKKGTWDNRDVEKAIQKGIAERANGNISDQTNSQLTVKALQGSDNNKIDMNIINKEDIIYDGKGGFTKSDGTIANLSTDMNKFIINLKGLEGNLKAEESIEEALKSMGLNETIVKEIDKFFKDKVVIDNKK